ncbi:dual adapter for phosphotyrosine and 3-phosphotyrosine and 3-phosphoinositide [Anaeramoeba flamelloides]|uniref:Dual adapter for phosphotyrosine and 3-phosphotyrosine and 3-phosphoinositide n=1 Tax=Anaeramoeba flamelloides TaxID=1746091 RepID=A0AAV7YWN3_9EUKA|nr:dual adapter for phosphotyrosine and 3-phosphotyrosine and 3-phosphoinositide [Anaeramoeba flamelloides]
MNNNTDEQIILQGYLYTYKALWKSVSKRYFVLYSRRLLCYKSLKEYEKKKPFLQQLPLSGLTFQHVSEEDLCKNTKKQMTKKQKFCFKLINKQPMEYLYSTDNLNEGLRWSSQLSNLLQIGNLPNNKIKENKEQSSNQSQNPDLVKIKINPDGVFTFIEKYQFLDSMSFITEEKLCLLTPNNLELRNLTDKNNILIPCNTIESIRMFSENGEEFKVLISPSKKTPVFLINSDPLQILTISSFLAIFSNKDSMALLSDSGQFLNSTMSSYTDLEKFFEALLIKIFSILIHLKNPINLPNYIQENCNFLKINNLFTDFLNSSDPSTQIQNLENNLIHLHFLIILLFVFSWTLPKPLLQQKENDLSDIYNTQLLDEKNILSTKHFFNLFDSSLQNIFGTILLISNLVCNEYKQFELIDKIASLLINMLHFNEMNTENDPQEILSTVKNKYPFIKFLISKSQYIFHNKWNSLKGSVFDRKLEFESKLNHLVGIKNKQVDINKNDNNENGIVNKQLKSNLERISTETQSISSTVHSELYGFDAFPISLYDSASQISDNLSIGDFNNEEDYLSLDFLGKQTEEMGLHLRRSYIVKTPKREEISDDEEENALHSFLRKVQDFYEDPLPLIPLTQKDLQSSTNIEENKDLFKSNNLTEQLEDLLKQDLHEIQQIEKQLLLLMNPEPEEDEPLIFDSIIDGLCSELISISIQVIQENTEYIELAECINDEFDTRPIQNYNFYKIHKKKTFQLHKIVLRVKSHQRI